MALDLLRMALLVTYFDRLVARGWVDRWRGTSGFMGRAIHRADVRWVRQMVAIVKATEGAAMTLFLLNLCRRWAERSRRGYLFGPALLDRVKGLK